MQADMVGDFLLRVSVLSLSNAKIKDLTLLFLIIKSPFVKGGKKQKSKYSLPYLSSSFFTASPSFSMT
jgi:hypothetical protein